MAGIDGLAKVVQDFLAAVHQSNFPPDIERNIAREADQVLFDVLVEHINIAKKILGNTLDSTLKETLVGELPDDKVVSNEPVWDKVGTQKYTAPRPKEDPPKGPAPIASTSFFEATKEGGPGLPEFGRRSPGPGPDRRPKGEPDRRHQRSHSPTNEIPTPQPLHRGLEHDLHVDPSFRSMKKAIGRGQVRPAHYNPISGHLVMSEKRSPSNVEIKSLDNRRRGSDWGAHDADKARNFGLKNAPRNDGVGGHGAALFNSTQHESALRNVTGQSKRENQADYNKFKQRNHGSNIF